VWRIDQAISGDRLQGAADCAAFGWFIACGISARPGAGGLNIVSGSFDPTTVAEACKRLGVPQRITRKASGLVIWHYGAGLVTFKGQRIVALDNGYGAEISTTYPRK
jgi:hypothetical protein